MSSQPVTLRRASWGLLLLFLPPLLAGCSAKSINALKVQDTLMEAYRRAQTEPDDRGARKYVDSAIALAPNDPATYFADPSGPPPQIGVAGVFGAIGDDPALMDYMKQATVLAKTLQKPGATEIETLTLLQAQACFDAGDPVTGAAIYQKAIQAYPNGSDPPNGLAYAYAVTNTHLPEALALAQQALALAQKGGGKPSDAKDANIAAIQDTLAWVQYRQGDYKDAEQNLLDAVNFDPRRPEMRFHLGSVYAAEGKTDAARAEFGHAVLLCPGYAEAQTALDRLPKAGTSS